MSYRSAETFFETDLPGGDDRVPAPPPDTTYQEFIRTLFREHNQALIGFLASRLRSDAEAEDVAQEAYVRLLQLEQPGTVSFIRAYLFRIAANLAADRLRQRAVREKCTPEQTFAFERLLNQPNIEHRAITEQQLELIKAALKEMPDKCRAACVLHFFADRSVKEIAAEMCLTERMIRYHIARGLAHCRARLDGQQVAAPP